MRYLSLEEILYIHRVSIEKFGGSSGIRDMGLLESAVSRPMVTFNSIDLYKNIEDKAIALFQSLLMNHPFVDGNKRTAFASMELLIELNGHNLSGSDSDWETFLYELFSKKLDFKGFLECVKSRLDRDVRDDV